MKIAINAVAAFKEKRTGVEEYAYQLIKNFTKIDCVNQFVLYKSSKQENDLDFELPPNFQIKTLRAPFLWSQIRLAIEIFLHKPDILFVPAQVAPFFCVKNSIVTVHGLEYEYFPKCYPLWFRKYLRFFTKYALRHARKIITVSENTKKDLVKLYGGNEDKIKVVWHGVEGCHPEFISGSRIGLSLRGGGLPAGGCRRGNLEMLKIGQHDRKNYILYIGRIETKKNLLNLIKAFNIFKQKYVMSHKLILIGGKGYGWQKIYQAISQSEYKNDIILTGFLDSSKKLTFLKSADLFVFLSFYEGFGMPALEAMSCGVPVLASNCSSLPEVCGGAAVLIDPHNIEEIAKNMYNVISKEELKNSLIQKGFFNVKRFSWEECARKTLDIIRGTGSQSSNWSEADLRE